MDIETLAKAILEEVYCRKPRKTGDITLKEIETEISCFDSEGKIEELLLNRGTNKAFDLIADMNMLFIKAMEDEELLQGFSKIA